MQDAARQDVVVATIDGQPILAGEVERLVERARQDREINPAALPQLRERLLAEIVDRRLVLAYAERTKSGPTPEEIDAAVTQVESMLKAQGRSVDEHLRELSMTAADMRRQIAWDLTWPGYVARYATDARLEAYFNAHRRDFDGTQITVCHVLLQPPADAGPDAMDQLLQRAKSIRAEIDSGKVTFAEAAEQYSTGPSAEQGGQLGPIGRRGPMVEAFSRAAFSLEVNQISPPVVTPFGVHLIRCDAIEPGKKTWPEVRESLEEALAEELLDRLARHQEGFSRVAYPAKPPSIPPTSGVASP